MINDLRYAVRQLTKHPGFTLIAIFALALGIGANTAIFSVVNAVLLRPLPYPQPDRLVQLRESTSTFPNGSVSYPNYLDWREGQHSFADLALVRRESFNLAFPGGDAAPDRISGARVSYGYLSILDLKPLIGRDLTEADDRPGAAPVVLLGENVWRTRFGGTPKVLGQQVVIDGEQREIIGVLSESVKFPRLSQVWLPLGDIRKQPNIVQRGNHPGFSVLGRLKPGVSLSQAKADLDTIAANLEKKYPDTNTSRRVMTQLLLEATVGEYRQSLNLLLGAVACVLLIACANVANLQLARALSRSKELAVRAALGASRWVLARQLLTESTVLAILGAVAGVILASWSLDVIISLSPQNIPRFKETRIDITALVFTGLVALAAGIAAGIWPAWRISNTSALSVVLHEAGSRGGSGGAARQRARSVLVITQVALAVMLLAAAGLTLKSFWRAQNEPLNFDPHNILLTAIDLPMAGYDKMPIIRGRAFGPEDVAEKNRSRSVIIDQTFAQRYFPGRDPIGLNIDDNQRDDNVTGSESTSPPLTIIGVVARTRNEAPGENNVEKLGFVHMYFSSEQNPASSNTLLLRATSGDPKGLASAARREVQAIDPAQPIGAVATMEERIGSSLSTRRLTMTLVGAFAALALLLASVGLYGVMALTITQRTRELGIRMALGAARTSIFRLVLGQGMSLIGLGIVLGLVGAIGVGRALMSLLYGVSGLDLGALFAAIFSLALIALNACCVPARRATRVDPMVALREE